MRSFHLTIRLAAGFLGLVLWSPVHAVSPCDLNNDALTNVSDVQLCANQAIGTLVCTNGDIDLDGTCSVIDVQRVVNAALGGQCVTPSATTARGPQASITCPAGAVVIAAGSTTSSRQALINGSAAGTAFCLKPGVHTANGSNTPKSGMTFVGEYGAIIDGTGWTTSDLDEAIFRSVNNGVTGVTIKNLIMRYGPSYGVNAYLTAANWTLDHNEIQGFRNGVSVGINGIISNNWIHHNKGILNDPRPELRGGGIVLNSSRGTRITGNEISYNGQEQKIIYGTLNEVSQNYYIADNFVHHNVSDGIWFDGDGFGSIVERNTVEDNGGPGITLEATNGVTVRNNFVRRQTAAEGIYLTIAKNNTVTGNLLEDNKFGIGLYLDFESLPPYSPNLPWTQDLTNNTISGNTVRIPVGSYGGMLTIRNVVGGDATPYSTNTKGNVWSNNTYYAPNTTGNWFMWANVNRSFTQWQAIPQDATSTLAVNP